MFKKEREKDIDITSLNHILRTGKKIINICYFMAIVILIILAGKLIKDWKILAYLKEIIVTISPIFIGLLIAWLFEPLVVWFEEKKIPRLLGCIIVYVALIGLLLLITYLFVPALLNQVKDFVKEAPNIFNNITDFFLNILNRFAAGGTINVDNIKKEVANSLTSFGAGITSSLPKYILNVSKALINGGINFALGLMIGFYLLFDFKKVTKAVHNMIPETWKDGYNELIMRINTSLRSYVQGVLLVMLLVFITQSIGLTIAGMEAPILFALFCAVTDIIPYFGPYIGAIPAILVGFTISPITGVCVIISILVVQLLENNFYQPLIMGHTMKLHPVTIMLGLLIFGHFFGIIGMIVATPCIACIKVVTLFILERTGKISIIKEKKEEDIEIKPVKITKVRKKELNK